MPPLDLYITCISENISGTAPPLQVLDVLVTATRAMPRQVSSHLEVNSQPGFSSHHQPVWAKTCRAVDCTVVGRAEGIQMPSPIDLVFIPQGLDHVDES